MTGDGFVSEYSCRRRGWAMFQNGVVVGMLIGLFFGWWW